MFFVHHWSGSRFLLAHSIINAIVVFAAIQLEVVSEIEADIRSYIPLQKICGEMQIYRGAELLEVEIVVYSDTKTHGEMWGEAVTVDI